MGKLLLIRHVQSMYNVPPEDRSEGWKDIPPSPNGMKEIQDTIDDLKGVPVDAVATTDLKRGRVLAEALAKEFGVKLVSSPGLRSWNTGKFAGKPRKELAKAFEYYKKNPSVKVPEGESRNDFIQRWKQSLEILQRAANQAKGYLVAVTHSKDIEAVPEILGGPKMKEGEPHTASIWLLDGNKLTPWDKEEGESEPEESSDTSRQRRDIQESGTTKVSKEAAGFMDLPGAEKDRDGDCHIVELPDGLSRKLSCCNLFELDEGQPKEFRCGTCEYVGEK